MRIWKFPLEVTDRQSMRIPAGAKLLTVQMQRETPCLWALVDDSTLEYEIRSIAIYGTGNPMPNDPGDYIATFQLAGGALVFHAFELR